MGLQPSHCPVISPSIWEEEKTLCELTIIITVPKPCWLSMGLAHCSVKPTVGGGEDPLKTSPLLKKHLLSILTVRSLLSTPRRRKVCVRSPLPSCKSSCSSSTELGTLLQRLKCIGLQRISQYYSKQLISFLAHPYHCTSTCASGAYLLGIITRFDQCYYR